jgi:hypothetical protein
VEDGLKDVGEKILKQEPINVGKSIFSPFKEITLLDLGITILQIKKGNVQFNQFVDILFKISLL